MTELPSPLQALIRKGVAVPHPESVYVAPEVNPDRIHSGATLHPGTRLLGASLSIGPDCEIGGETPATVDGCQLGAKVSLKGGYFKGAVFLDGAGAGSAAHVRPGCLLEEQAGIAHAVGLKQTILFPFVTLGSLINFCDVLMAGGTSRKNHSEVGSSFIHFNFTPHGDKATASLIGEVARGVLLDQPPIFLGGQGGIVGPVEMTYGVVQAAGGVCRRDLPEPDHLYQSAPSGERYKPYRMGAVREPAAKLEKNLRYLGNLSALRLWYRNFRRPLAGTDPFRLACLDGAEALLEGALKERRKRLAAWGEIAVGADAEFDAAWPGVMEAVDAALEAEGDGAVPAEVAGRASGAGSDYVETVRGLAAADREAITTTLQHEINRFARAADLLNQET